MDLQAITTDAPEDDEFDSPHGSKWIVAVDDCGLVSILRRPNIHYSFFDNGEGAEEIGLPSEAPGTNPGVYEWTCDFTQVIDWESGLPDDYTFDVIAEVCLYSLPTS
jgi:hypothetical protein